MPSRVIIEIYLSFISRFDSWWSLWIRTTLYQLVFLLTILILYTWGWCIYCSCLSARRRLTVTPLRHHPPPSLQWSLLPSITAGLQRCKHLSQCVSTGLHVSLITTVLLQPVHTHTSRGCSWLVFGFVLDLCFYVELTPYVGNLHPPERLLHLCEAQHTCFVFFPRLLYFCSGYHSNFNKIGTRRFSVQKKKIPCWIFLAYTEVLSGN